MLRVAAKHGVDGETVREEIGKALRAVTRHRPGLPAAKRFPPNPPAAMRHPQSRIPAQTAAKQSQSLRPK